MSKAGFNKDLRDPQDNTELHYGGVCYIHVWVKSHDLIKQHCSNCSDEESFLVNTVYIRLNIHRGIIVADVK